MKRYRLIRITKAGKIIKGNIIMRETEIHDVLRYARTLDGIAGDIYTFEVVK